MAIALFAAILSVCLFLVNQVLLAPISLVASLHLPGWMLLTITLLSLAWLMAE